MRKRLFFRNAAILTFTSLLLRSIGIIFRIYVSNRIGAEGMGLYQLILSVYILAASFASSGLTTAVTKLCTDELAFDRAVSARRILTTAILISVIVGLCSGILLYRTADAVAIGFLHDARAVPSLKILTVSLPFMGASSCIKGYFLAKRKVMSSSVSQILEQIVRIAAILSILELNHVQTVEEACFTVLLGDTIAEAVSCLYIVIVYIFDVRGTVARDCTKPKGILRELMRISLPITGGRYLNSGLRTVENILVPDRLFRFNGSREVSLSQFGALKGMALPLLFFPSSFLTAFTSLLIPEISEAKALNKPKRLQRTIEHALHWTLLSSFLIGGVFFLLAYPLALWLYHNREVGRFLMMLAPLAPVMYLESVVVGILKGLDQQTHSLLYSVWDSALRIGAILLIVPTYGINGFYGVMVISNLLTCGLNLHRLCAVTHIRLRIRKWIIKPLFAVTLALSVPMLLTKLCALRPEQTSTYCIISGILVTGVYVALLPLFKCIEYDDLIVTVAKRRRSQ